MDIYIKVIIVNNYFYFFLYTSRSYWGLLSGPNSCIFVLGVIIIYSLGSNFSIIQRMFAAVSIVIGVILLFNIAFLYNVFVILGVLFVF